MATAKKRAAREERDRARAYAARQQVHAVQTGRRRRDNIIALSVASAIVLGAIGGQTLFYTVGPGSAAESGVAEDGS
ncbi:dioxygenase [Microbacterium sp. gxy059]|uniref:dioxygenase n=1 Tax=Microbacterium sp. gxy059 TaxID=2957199 RepID=UPI003D9843A2